jgi:hypothetical protein
MIAKRKVCCGGRQNDTKRKAGEEKIGGYDFADEGEPETQTNRDKKKRGCPLHYSSSQ